MESHVDFNKPYKLGLRKTTSRGWHSDDFTTIIITNLSQHIILEVHYGITQIQNVQVEQSFYQDLTIMSGLLNNLRR